MNIKTIDQPFVSVVTPFYNTEDYLQECIESVLRQSYKNFEYILVNNRSTDRSLGIAETLAQTDSRIRVITNKIFLDKVKNYNHALRQISIESKYCKIVQADDLINKDCLLEMVSIAEMNPSIGIVSSYFHLGSTLKNTGLPYPQAIFRGQDICRLQLLTGSFYIGNFSTIMIRSEIVRNRNPFYNECTYHEDTEACYEILNDWDFGFVHQVLSFTRTDNESLYKSTLRFNPDIIDYFIVINKYGPLYLKKSEFSKRLKQIKYTYFKFLGHSALFCRNKEFWNYHINGLRIIGYELSRITLVRYSLLSLISLLFHPISTIRRIINIYRSKTGESETPPL